MDRARIEAAEVEDVVVGCGLPEGATGHNVARNAALEAGFGVGVPGMTMNRYCGSGLSAASIVANRIAAGEAVAVAGGVESISLVQFNCNLDGFFYEPLQQRMPAVWWTMNQTADFVSKKYGITREAQDEYVVRSQQRVAAATAAGKYAEEIVPFSTTMKVIDKATKAAHDQPVTLDRDEGPRPDTRSPSSRRFRRCTGRDHHGGQRLAALRRRGRGGHDGRRSGRQAGIADPGPLPRHAALRGRARRDEHRDRPGDS